MSGILQLILSFCELEVSHWRFFCGLLCTACTALRTALYTALRTALRTALATALATAHACYTLTGRPVRVHRSQSCWCAG